MADDVKSRKGGKNRPRENGDGGSGRDADLRQSSSSWHSGKVGLALLVAITSGAVICYVWLDLLEKKRQADEERQHQELQRVQQERGIQRRINHQNLMDSENVLRLPCRLSISSAYLSSSKPGVVDRTPPLHEQPISTDLMIPHEFDFLIFAQRWLPTACYNLRVRGYRDCRLPPGDGWTIHGLWPERSGKKQTQYCKYLGDSANNYDEDVVKVYMKNMEETFTAVDASESHHAFWRHQWEKHGTCAVLLDALSSQDKYCRKSLALHGLFNMRTILGDVGITPGRSYNLQDLLRKLFQKLGNCFLVQCLYNKETHTLYLLEIRICLDKSFNRISYGKIPGGQPAFLPADVLYPLQVPVEPLDKAVKYSFSHEFIEQVNSVKSRKK